jgi:hypothetical protein
VASFADVAEEDIPEFSPCMVSVNDTNELVQNAKSD